MSQQTVAACIREVTSVASLLYNSFMALVEYIDGKRELSRDRDKVKRLVLAWRALVGEDKDPDPDIAVYAKTIKRIRLNWHEAPEDYIRWNLNEILPQVLNEWAVDMKGKPLRPGNSRSWDFAKRYGLWKAGKPTNIVTGEQTVLV